MKYAEYKTFAVGDAASLFKLTVGGYSGNAGKIIICWWLKELPNTLTKIFWLV